MRKGVRKTRREKVLAPTEVAALLHAARELGETAKTPKQRLVLRRDYMLFWAQYLLGLRAGEVTTLRYSHVRRSDAAGCPTSIWVPTLKKAKTPDGLAPLEPVAVLSYPGLMRTIFDRAWRPRTWQRSIYLFPSPRDMRQPYPTTSASRRFKVLLREAGLDPIYSPHSLRHSASSALARAGASKNMVAEFLRHSVSSSRAGMTVTDVYLHATDDDWEKLRGALDLPRLQPLPPHRRFE